MKRYLLLVFLLALAGCKHHMLINRSAVKMIKVVRYRDEHDSITTNYTDASVIRKIAKTINNNKKQRLEFEMDCTVHVIYADSVANFQCNGTCLRYKGTTYKIPDSMEDVLN